MAFQNAFTLIELLVVIGIIGIVMAISVPIYGSIRMTSDKTNCLSNLKQIIAASNLAAADNNNTYPNMHGYAWEQGDVWIADELAPYVGGIKNADPAKLLRCPAALKNQQEAWLEGSQYCHYKYNIWYAQNKKPLYGYAKAMLFFDTTWPDWTQKQFAHYPGSGANLNVGYVDGHVATVPYAEYKALNQSQSDESKNDFFKVGWVKEKSDLEQQQQQ